MKKLDLSHIDYLSFARDLENLKSEIDNNIDEKDYKHLRKIELWGKICTLVGYLTAWICINPFSAFLISQGNVTRWAMITHHVTHKGYDKVPGIKNKYKSKYYAKGWRRFFDWAEWMHPEGWSLEHNILHHYHTGEMADPDFAQKNVQMIRNAQMPKFLKYLIIFFFMTNWKLTYYAPNTFWFLLQQKKKKGKLKDNYLDFTAKKKVYPGATIFMPFSSDGLKFWINCVLPYFSYRFVFIPILFLPFGTSIWFTVLFNSLLAEIFTNIHSFIIIVPNHTGDDVPFFKGNISDKEEFYVRQVIGSVNYTGGNDLSDFLQGWLNYQIEHHLWPDIPMLKYQEYQVRVEEICKNHGVPYIRENIFQRFIKLLDILVGNSSMVPVKTNKV